MPVVTDYTALLSGNYWTGIEQATATPVIVTFSFPTSAPAYDSSVAGFTAATLSSFTAFTPTEQAQAISALGEWAAASGLIFVEVAPGQGDINFQNVDFSTTNNPSYAGFGGIGFYPFGNWNFWSYPYYVSDLDASGDVFMNSQFVNPDGTVNYGTLLHEIGHAIGLKHPTEVVTDYAAQPNPVVHDQVLSADDPSLTIMATTEDTTTGADSHLQQLDMNAAAALYGAAGTGGVYTGAASGTNSVSSWSWDPTTQTLTQFALSTNEAVRGTSVNDIIHGLSGDKLFALAGNDILYGGGGGDFLYGGTGTDTLYGGPGGNSFFVQSPTTTVIENNIGSADTVYATVSFALPVNVDTLQLSGQGLTGTANNDANNTLFGDGTYATTLIGGAGSDYMAGGAGNDTLIAGTGPDTMYGAGGDNTFVYRSVADAAIGANLTTIGDFAQGTDKIDLSGITTTGANPGQPLHFIGTAAFSDTAGEVREVFSGSNAIVEGDTNGDGVADFEIQLYNAPVLQTSDFAFLSMPCYRAGTHILTDRGVVPVEALSVGGIVLTASGHARPIVWIGHRVVDCLRHPEQRKVWPVLVRAGAFSDNVPHRDLWLSPDHAVFVDDGLIPIRHLINGASIQQVPMETVAYYHVELDRHDVLLAEGLPAESYLDTGNRCTFANGGRMVALHPRFDVPKTWRDDAAAPLVNDEARVRPVWERLAARSSALGMPITRPALTDDPEVRLEVDGRLIRPVAPARDRCRFVLPPRASLIRLLSRSGYATDARPWIDDERSLGIYVARITWHSADGVHDMPLDHPGLDEGWWDVESDDHLLRRWTDGSALLPPWPGAIMVELHWGGDMRYRLDRDETWPAQLAA